MERNGCALPRVPSYVQTDRGKELGRDINPALNGFVLEAQTQERRSKLFCTVRPTHISFSLARPLHQPDLFVRVVCPPDLCARQTCSPALPVYTTRESEQTLLKNI